MGIAVNITAFVASSTTTSIPIAASTVKAMSGMMGESGGCKLSVRYLKTRLLPEISRLVCIMIS